MGVVRCGLVLVLAAVGAGCARSPGPGQVIAPPMSAALLAEEEADIKEGVFRHIFGRDAEPMAFLDYGGPEAARRVDPPASFMRRLGDLGPRLYPVSSSVVVGKQMAWHIEHRVTKERGWRYRVDIVRRLDGEHVLVGVAGEGGPMGATWYKAVFVRTGKGWVFERYEGPIVSA